MPSFYIDRHSWPDSGIWRAPTRSPLLRLTYSRGSVPQIPVRFVDAGAVVELGSGASVGIGFKATRGAASWLITPVAATKSGTGTSAVYTVAPNILSDALDTLLGDNDSAAVIQEVYWTDSGSGGTAGSFGNGSIQSSARIYQNLNVGGESLPTVPVAFLDLTPVADTNASYEVSAASGNATVAVSALAGTTAYTYKIVLITTGVPTGAEVDLRITLPASANPTIEVRNATAVGTLLHTITGDSSSVRYQNVRFRKTAAAWQKFASADIV